MSVIDKAILRLLLFTAAGAIVGCLAGGLVK